MVICKPLFVTAKLTGTNFPPGLTTPEILGNAFLFFVAGYETTATAVTHLLYHLALNQDCQEKLYQEIQKVMGDNVSTRTAL